MSIRFIDTHCHFDFPPFTGDEADSLRRAAEAGVEKIIIPATEAAHFGRVLALAEQFPPLFAALGLHPIVIERHQRDSLERLQQALEKGAGKVVAVGEIGLDLYRDDPQFERQESLFALQLNLAKRYDLPVILHSRRTHDKLAMHLKRQDLPRTGVVHGFSGSLQQAERFVQLGYKIGVGGTITYPRASKTRDVMAQLPLEALLLETDAPDMPLNGFQGQPNRPEQAARVFSVLCELRPEPADVIAEALYRNTMALFNLHTSSFTLPRC
ncbi:metal-dependent hydrolase [Citrobacter amalonaticus]|uniref:Metal-dependent hydrolase n=1 Tax=Citrobacter amalonaticus TaxID=35703 RepID=A0A2S4RXI7_CITAM|nr:metal-dependent hydrolase [Citrobacter amalonaticus]POT56070.1 metal-dependent hydrolase [Citrobacter amalonaticus]POT74378.1 metal-dependent hydrolase [Citrobacter amalonaticus]POU65179.1 metal-dependent hydrolase [Citrobacter amalonaticus]POV04013.1 metal-dependent hydrolase [Citrobacter amalonaticus]